MIKIVNFETELLRLYIGSAISSEIISYGWDNEIFLRVGYDWIGHVFIESDLVVFIIKILKEW